MLLYRACTLPLIDICDIDTQEVFRTIREILHESNDKLIDTGEFSDIIGTSLLID